MTPLASQLLSRISIQGPLSFSEFMATALYEPHHGFYSSGRARIGKAGDFYTAVSVGPLFGRLLARQFAQMWEYLGRPAPWCLVEQGANDGQLALDVLEALEEQSPDCFNATQLWILEPLLSLQKSQSEKLSAFHTRTAWFRDPEDLPSFVGVHYSNELLDAFPFDRVRCQNGAWLELRVDGTEDGFSWKETPIRRADLQAACDRLPALENGFTTELGFAHRPWLEAIAHRLTRGWLIALDYGMSEMEMLSPHRREGTLAAYQSHQRCPNPLDSPGERDLTAHVNFSAVARDALERGWQLCGYTDQHRFFSSLAPLHFTDATEALSPAQQKERLAFRTLIHPQLMGTQFKVLCLHKGDCASQASPPALAGFRFAGNSMTHLGLVED